MDNFVVSARKYRPSTFDTVIGQNSITTTLKNAIKNNHLAQAFLFCGPRGVGKTTCARILAKTINCKNISEKIEACDQCESCISFNTSHSFNIHELDAASNNHVDDIRSLIDQVRIAPQVGRYSIYIIDEVHMLSMQAFNAFLKTLEEPPSYAIFILATTSKQKIIPTILSRCQIFDFSRIRVEDIANHLANVARKEGVKADPEALHVIAQKADGSLRDSLSIFDQMVSFGETEVTYNNVIENLNILDYDYYFRAVNAILQGDITASLLLFDDVLNNGFDGHNYITGLSEHLRNLLVCKDQETLQLLPVGGKIREKFKEQADKCTSELLLTALSISNKCDISYNISVSKRLHIELVLMQLCSIGSIPEKTEKPARIISSSKPAHQVKTENPVKEPEAPKKESETNFEEPAVNYKTKEPEKEIETKKEEAPIEPEHKEVTDIKHKVERTIEEGEKKKEKTQSNIKDSIVEEAKPRGYSPKTKSLKDFIKESGEKEKTPEGPSDEYLKEKENATITQSELERVWNDYAELIHKTGKHSLFSTLTKRMPLLRENHEVELIIDNSVQSKELIVESEALHEYLRSHLSSSINVVTKIETKETKRKPYTAIEKFKRMAEKNPSIDKLRQKFDLDLD